MTKFLLVILLVGASSLSPTASPTETQTLDNINPDAAAKILTNGKWVLESVDMRSVDPDCKGKIWLIFSADKNGRKVRQQRCQQAQVFNAGESDWEVRKDQGVLYLRFADENSVLLFKDEGTAAKRHVYMRLRISDQTEPKGGINLIHDYVQVFDDQKK